MVVDIIGIGYLFSCNCGGFISYSDSSNNGTVGTNESVGVASSICCWEGSSGSKGTSNNSTSSNNTVVVDRRNCTNDSLMLDNGLGDDLGRCLVGGNSSLGNKVAHIVSGGPDDGGSLVVRDTDWDSPLAKHGSLHSVGVSLISPVGEVAAQTVALDDGRVMGWGADSHGSGECIRDGDNDGRGHSSQAYEK